MACSFDKYVGDRGLTWPLALLLTVAKSEANILNKRLPLIVF